MILFNHKQNLAAKLVVWIGGSVVLVLAASAFYIVMQVFSLEKQNNTKYMEAIATSEASTVGQELETAMNAARLLSIDLSSFEYLPSDQRRPYADDLLRQLLNGNPGFYGAWTCWEPNLFDGKDAQYQGKAGHDKSGRFIPYWFISKNGSPERTILTDYMTTGKGAYYIISRNTGQEQLLEPYPTKADESGTLITSIVTPIKNKYGRILGVAGIDITLENLSRLFINHKIFRTGHIELISSAGVIAIHPDAAQVGKPAEEFSGEKGKALLEMILSGKSETGVYRDQASGKQFTRSFIPLFVGNVAKPWIISASAPTGETMEDSYWLILKLILSFLAGLILVIVITVVLARSLVKPVKTASAALREIAEGTGDLTKEIPVTSSDEIGQLSEDFNLFVEKLNEIISAIRTSTARLNGIAQGLSANTEETSSAVYEINANIESVKQQVTNQSAGVTETSSTIEEIGTNIERLSGIINEQSDNISESSASVEEMVANIESVTRTLEKNGEQFITLHDASDTGFTKISDVVSRMQQIEQQSEGLYEANSVLRNISSQTNLLAMNAAIEAAHAGESGKGFAVVADEIRKLAENASTQSKLISKNLKDLKSSIDLVAVSSTEAGSAFNQVQSSITTVMEQQRQIQSAMKEQSTGNARVLEALSRMKNQSGTVNSNSAQIREGSRAIQIEMQELVSITQRIKESMDEMSLGTAEINKAVSDVVSLTQRNREGISEVSEQISQFKIRENADDGTNVKKDQ